MKQRFTLTSNKRHRSNDFDTISLEEASEDNMRITKKPTGFLNSRVNSHVISKLFLFEVVIRPIIS